MIAVTTFALVTWAALAGVAGAATEARRVGFANVARDGEAGRAAIAKMRGVVVSSAKGEELAAGARAALEDPVDPAASDGAATLARARSLVTSARDALKRFEYDDALDQLRQADGALRGLLPSPEVAAELYEVNLLAGQVHAARGDEPRALESFRLAHRLDPERAKLDPARYRPQIVVLYDEARAGTPDAGAATVRVVTEPPGAIVWLDGRAAGMAPIDLAGLAPGEHYVGASLDGHAPRSERLTVQKGGRLEQSFLLARLPAEQRARSVRAGLLRAGLSAQEWARGADTLADVASVDLLVLVRDAASGAGIEAAVWDVRSAKLGAWVNVTDSGAALAASVPDATGQISVPLPQEVAGKVLLGDGDPGGPNGPGQRRADKPRWYRTWWGVSLLIGGGIIVTGAVLVLTAPDAPPQTSLLVDSGWNDEIVGLRW